MNMTQRQYLVTESVAEDDSSVKSQTRFGTVPANEFLDGHDRRIPANWSRRASRFFLEEKNLAPSTINVRLAAVRRLASEASDTGLLSLNWLRESGASKGQRDTRRSYWQLVDRGAV
jgi:hypothetical protein